MVAGTAAFGIEVGGDAVFVIVFKTVLPVPLRGGGGNYSACFVIVHGDIGFIGVVPAGHVPLRTVFVPQMVKLKGVTFRQIPLVIIAAGHQPLALFRVQPVNGREPLALVVQRQGRRVGMDQAGQAVVFIVMKNGLVAVAVLYHGQAAFIALDLGKAQYLLGAAVEQAQLAVAPAVQQVMPGMEVDREDVFRRAFRLAPGE